MTEREATEAEQAAADALEALSRAYEEAARAIRAIPEPQRAFAFATRLAKEMRDAHEQASELRSEQVARIWEAEELSLAKLAQRIGVSKARADQLIRAAKGGKGREEQGWPSP